MLGLAEKLLNYDFVSRILNHNFADFLYNLGSTELFILKMLVVMLAVYIVYRLMGSGAVLVFLFILLISHVVYSANIFEFYEKRDKETKLHYEEIEKFMVEQKRMPVIKEAAEQDLEL